MERMLYFKSNVSRKYPFTKSLGFAIDGMKTSLKSEPNLKIHFVVALAVIILAFFLDLTTFEWAILSLTISLVFGAELFNTSLESLVNLLSPEKSEAAKLAKDISAAAVFTASIGAIFTGLFIFLPKLLPILFGQY